MLREYESSYIIKLQGKDVYDRELVITEGKRRGATLDYSLGTKKIQEVGNSVLAKTKAEQLFFLDETGKQCTNAVVSLGFDLNVNEFNRVEIGTDIYYKHYKSDLTPSQIRDAYELGYFDNGVYSDTIEPIEVVKFDAETNLTKEDLPRGFKVEEGKIGLLSSGFKPIANKSKIREELYKNGFKLVFQRKGRKDEVVEYVRFVRSAGQARVGSCLFIMKKLYKPMMKWALMDMTINKTKNIDLAGLEAYLSLCFSSIINTVEIKPEEILIIDDYESKFITKGMVTSDKTIDGVHRLVTEPREFSQSNSIWDGQALLDESVFAEKGYSDKGMLLLRNRFAKTCAFNTNIQRFFKDNGITDVSQLKGFTRAKKVEDIKLITTPSSIKYLKFGSLDEYFDKIDNEWGIVKYDKPTHYFEGTMVQTHYQLLNTLEFDYETMEEFLRPTLDYMNNLKTDTKFLKDHLRIWENSEVELTGEETKDDFIFKMLSICSRFEETKIFKTFRKNLVKAYKNNVKRGHVLVKGNYSTLFGNALEMLQASCGLFDETSLLDIDEVYSKNFDYGAETVNSRSPHVANGNIWVSRNCSKEKGDLLDRYFNLSKQIVIINSMNNNVLETLSGSDFDSDTMLMTDNEILLKLAKKNYGKYLTPTGNVSAKKVSRKFTEEEKAKLDTTTATNLIGEIINCSQIINSQIWECVKKRDFKKADELYVITSQLDVMSNLAIDSAKREFPVDLKLELKIIKETYIKVDLKPKFFEFIGKDKGNDVRKENYRWYETSMDYLIRIVDKESRKKIGKSDSGIDLTDIIKGNNMFNNQSQNRIGIVNILEKGLKARSEINSIWGERFSAPSEKFERVNLIGEEYRKYVKEVTLKPIDIKRIIYKMESNEEYSRARKFILNELYCNHPQIFLKLFS